jgi:hypothetical protein
MPNMYMTPENTFVPTTTFLRLLAADDKAAALRAAVAAVRAGHPAPDVFAVDPASFRQVPGTPFAYWVSESVRGIFATFPQFESGGRNIKQGLATADDFRFVRAWWEIAPSDMRIDSWGGFAKGGAHSVFYSDLHLLANWRDQGNCYRSILNPKSGKPYSNIWMLRDTAEVYFFRPGLTYPRRTNGFSVRVMPAGCIFADKGPAIFTAGDMVADLFSLLGIINSAPFNKLLSLLLGRVELAQSFEVGLIQQMPMPELDTDDAQTLATLAREAHDLKRDHDRDDEVTHPFIVPALARLRAADTLAASGSRLAEEDAARERRLAAIQREIDDRCFALYGFSDADRAQVEGGTLASAALSLGSDVAAPVDEDDGDDDQPAQSASVITRSTGAAPLVRSTADLLLYAVGCALGRWDARIGRDPTLAPKLADPFAPLPVCAPGTLVGLDGLPATPRSIASEAWLRARPDAITLPEPGSVAQPAIAAEAYPLPIAWDGILVDEPGAENDLVRRVRTVLDYLWGARADAIETQVCGILGVGELRDYFRNPRAFFEYHIGRYSKSRRKAPIYWLLQSPKRTYALWLYYHRLDADLLFKALNFHLLPKIRLEERHLDELKAAKQQAGTTGAEARRAALAVERQDALLADLREFRDALDRAARHYLTPDLNDGVLLNIAPLWEVVPWKEAKAAWGQLTAGKYAWSSIGKQLREKGHVKAR